MQGFDLLKAQGKLQFDLEIIVSSFSNLLSTCPNRLGLGSSASFGPYVGFLLFKIPNC